ncbi:hypothetical protein EW026_g6107 [Hermanssonia centrifuga]|uniref:Serine carboxypeptidase n=1 Tax=Hermanssonia centrifuga TaxID=98765 RepID=A0A4S4KC31_9APHY|nr:hypothetical protein EW026_g6107 [Hermanssonia centrifuga]
MEVNKEFEQEGDRLRPTYLLYEPLLKAGYRLLHYVGKLDANCAWPGIISFLKLLHTPFQEDFINTPDLAWGSEDAIVRAVGEGAGNMTYILMGGAGHFVTKDQPVLVKKIVEHWIDNRPFV